MFEKITEAVRRMTQGKPEQHAISSNMMIYTQHIHPDAR